VTEDGERRDVYIIAHHDGSMVDRGQGGVRVVTQRPEGMPADGSPQETLTILGGKPPKRLEVNMGAMRATVENGKTIKFRKAQSGKRQGRVVTGRQPSVIRGRH